MTAESRPTSQHIAELMHLFAFFERQTAMIDRNSSDVHELTNCSQLEIHNLQLHFTEGVPSVS